MLLALNKIVEQQSNPTQNTEAEIAQFLYYTSTNLSAIFQYKYINMILHIDSDASYLSEPRAHSRTGGHYYLRLLTADPEKYANLPLTSNGPIHTECRILKHVVESASGAEVRGMFQDGQTPVPLCITLHKLGCYPTTNPNQKR